MAHEIPDEHQRLMQEGEVGHKAYTLEDKTTGLGNVTRISESEDAG